jgi:hypothetical protein
MHPCPHRLAGPALAVLAAIALSSAPGCAIRRASKLGPSVESQHVIAPLDADAAAVELTFFAGDLRVTGGGESVLELTSIDNFEEAGPRVEFEREGRQLDVRAWVDTESRLEVRIGDDDAVNRWDARLGARVPLSLALELAACDAKVDLGGAALRRLSAGGAAGSFEFDWSSPNAMAASELDFDLGAGEFSIERLGNARAASSRFRLQAGDYLIDLGGEWVRPGLVRIEARFCNVEVRVPAGLQVRIDGRDCDLGEVEVSGIEAQGDGRWADDSRGGSDAQVTIELDVEFAGVSIVRQ